MKFIRNKIFIIFAIVSLILLIIEIESRTRAKSSRMKHKRNSKSNLHKEKNFFTSEKIKKAKENCNKSCEGELKTIEKNNNNDKTKRPFEMKSYLFRRKHNINTEYLICRCKFTNSGVEKRNVFFYANKLELDKFIKEDIDGTDVSVRNQKKLRKSDYKYLP